MRKKRSASENGLRQIVGIIIPSAWDADGRATGWSIAAYNEKTYQINVRNETGRRILAHAGKKIKLLGNINKKNKPLDSITVKEYEVIEESLP